MKLYTNPASRGCFVEWYVSEIGKESEVEVVNLDMGDKREHKSDWYKKVSFNRCSLCVSPPEKTRKGTTALHLSDR